MGKPREALGRVKLVTGILYAEAKLYGSAKSLLERAFGRTDFESPERDFTHTDYYETEMGPGLKRRFLSFETLAPLDGIYRAKLKTNSIEERLSSGQKRRVNIDPGYLDLGKFVLFSTKDYSHRIYLQNGIYAEVTLYYKNKGFRPWPWTYPDYRTDRYAEILNSIRGIYKAKIQ